MNQTSKVNALLTALDALRADVEELDRAYEREREHTRDLETQLSDLTDDFCRVMDEDCESDLEKHCACVPHLRRRIAELEAPGECNSIHRLQAQVGDLQRKLRVENGSSPDAPEGWVRSAKGPDGRPHRVTGINLGRACIAAAAAIGRWPGGAE